MLLQMFTRSKKHTLTAQHTERWKLRCCSSAGADDDRLTHTRTRPEISQQTHRQTCHIIGRCKINGVGIQQQENIRRQSV